MAWTTRRPLAERQPGGAAGTLARPWGPSGPRTPQGSRWPLPPRPPPGGGAGHPALTSCPRAAARSSRWGGPGGRHGPLRVDQRPSGDPRGPGDPAARGAHLRRRGEGRAAARPGQASLSVLGAQSAGLPGLPRASAPPELRTGSDAGQVVPGGRARGPIPYAPLNLP